MRIVVAGAGDLGTYLIEELSAERHDLSVIEKSGEKLEKLASKHDVATFKGNVLSYDNLLAVGVPEADLFVAVTESEERNLMSAILAKRVGAARVVARVRHSKLMQHNDVFNFSGLGVDEIISPDALAADEIATLLDKRAFSHLVKFEHGKFLLAGLLITDKDTLVGKTMRQLGRKFTKEGAVPIALVRAGETYRVTDDHSVQVEDHLYFVASQAGVHSLAKVKSGKRRQRKRAMIIGGSRAGIETTRRLQAKGYQVTVVESKREMAEEMVDFLPGALVIYGDTQEPGFLEDHNVADMDAVVAATGNPEINIIACLIAKQQGVRHTVAFVKDVHYLKGAHKFGVDTLINKKFIAADFIVRHAKKKNVLSVASVPELDMEVFEFVVKERSPITGIPLSSVDLIARTDVVIGGILSAGTVVMPSPSYIFQPGDRVVVACHNSQRESFQSLL